MSEPVKCDVLNHVPRKFGYICSYTLLRVAFSQWMKWLEGNCSKAALATFPGVLLFLGKEVC